MFFKRTKSLTKAEMSRSAADKQTRLRLQESIEIVLSRILGSFLGI